MVDIRIGIEQLENGFLVRSEYLGDSVYFEDFKAARNYVITILNDFYEDEIQSQE